MSSLLDESIRRFKLGSPTKARKLIKSGFIHVNGNPIQRPDHICSTTDQITLATKSERKETRLPFEILLNDDAIIVVIKPPGITSEEFHQKLRLHLGQVYLTHRLDREVSGVMIFAKSYAIEKQLEKGWPNNAKIYLALTEGTPDKAEGTIETWLSETKELRVYSGPQIENAKHAVTHYRVLNTTKHGALLEVRLETGRKHQIRVHLSDMGCPIVGDQKYGAKTKMQGRIALHAYRLAFDHPVTGKRIELIAQAPSFFPSARGGFK